MRPFDVTAITLAFLFLFDRLWKAAAIWDFFRRPPPPDPRDWPSVSLIQPVTVSPNDLAAVLRSRAQIKYPLPVEHIIVLDRQDTTAQALCRDVMRDFPAWHPSLVMIDAAGGIAMKTVKQQAGLDAAGGEVLCFIDDDILLRQDTLHILVRHLYRDGAGSTFGLACYANWNMPWSAAMSAFVNANALLNYIPSTYLTAGFTITGHLYAFKREDFLSMGGLSGLKNRLDDDHELARRVVKAGRCNLQTPALYDVENELPSLRDFLQQMKRWFVFPRELMLPEMPASAKLGTFLTSLPNLIPGALLAAALFGSRAGWLAAGLCLFVSYCVYFWSARRYLKLRSPAFIWFLLPLAVFVLPYQIVLSLFSNSTIVWRGQRLRVKRGGEYDVIKPS